MRWLSRLPLRRLTVKGFASLEHVTVDFETPVTVLIGANGAGKSNIVRALELLGEIVDRRLQDYVATRGGFARMLHRGADAENASEEILLRAEGVPDDGGLANGYEARLTAGPDDEVVLAETLMVQDVAKYDRPYTTGLGSSRESRLDSAEGRTGAFARYVREVLTSCRVYHFDDVSPDAPPKRRSDVADNLELRRDAGNLPAYLYRLRAEERAAYDRIVAAVRSVAPFFDDFVLEPRGVENDTILLRWRQTSTEGAFSASQLSDGTLRFVCLATLLLSPDRPKTIVLDEPELGLHPFAIHQLAELLQAAAHGDRKVILATQSVPLLEEFPLEAVVVVERRDGRTTAKRPDGKALTAFVDDYSLGELWRMNLLGGRPEREQAATS